MFKTLMRLSRSRSFDLIQDISDANALSMLRQQISDGAAAVQSAQRALALVTARSVREKQMLMRIDARIDDLETRCLGALALDRDDLAGEGAAAIARLESDHQAMREALDTNQREIAALHRHLAEAEQRLHELDCGGQIATAAEDQSLRGEMTTGVTAAINEAEARLARLQARQQIIEVSETSLSALTSCQSAEAISARMAAAGCGPALETDAAAVLARLRSRQN